ncbi:nucleotide exchange factor GrpE [Tetzosporium hominis]|uniref:Protein GrpE n=1 Tax=Tetzosporium hominis TaxID=2020506 RepID=A0A264W5L7_9BACL|nr:nucleotide exchange factor GrpE [Tetzosporium hominis]OZS78872.1 nucleotide exchange factor GrpE [Tetzosporium hominis]
MTEENKQPVEQPEEVEVELETKDAEQAVEQTEEVEVELETKDAEQAETSEEVQELSEIEELQAKLDEQENSYLRLRADFDNYRRRVQRDTEAASKFRAQSLVTELLPVLDNFERALESKPQSEDAKTLLTGVEMVYRTLKQALSNEGVEEIVPTGEAFDPNFHQAVMKEPSEEFESGIVIQTLQKGYQLKDRVIRPAMVKVSE